MGAQPGCAIWLCTTKRLTIHAQISLNYAEKTVKMNKRSGAVASSKQVSPYHVEFSGVFLKLINTYVLLNSLSLLSCNSSHSNKWKLRKNNRNSVPQTFCKTFCETQQVSQASTCDRASLKYSCRVPGRNFIKKKTLVQVFSCHSFKQVQNLVVLKSFSQPANQNL